MSTTPLRLAGSALFFILIFLFGFWLSRSGKPYHAAVFTFHKLIALGAGVFLGMTIYKVNQVVPLNPAQILATVICAVCFGATVITGGLLSIDKAMPLFVLRLHQIMPYLTLLSTAATLYLLLAKSSPV